MLSSSSPRTSTTVPKAVSVSLPGRPPNLGIEWDAENRLVAVKEGGATIASYTYRNDGMRRTKAASGVTTSYLLENASVVEERSSTGTVVTHFDGPDLDSEVATRDSSGVIIQLTRDHLGSIRERFDVGGLVFRHEYDPWGRLLSGALGGVTYAGREWDSEPALYYYRARYYNPDTGRFLSEDPSGLKAGPNLYRYAANNPLGFNDPLGLDVINRSGCVVWIKNERDRNVQPVQPCEHWSGYQDGVAVPGRPGQVFKTVGKSKTVFGREVGLGVDVWVTEGGDVVPIRGEGWLNSKGGGGWKDENWHTTVGGQEWDVIFQQSYAKQVCPCKCK